MLLLPDPPPGIFASPDPDDVNRSAAEICRDVLHELALADTRTTGRTETPIRPVRIKRSADHTTITEE